MDEKKDLPVRKHVRLENYDYSAKGAYFVTVCIKDRKEILSHICRGDPCGRPQTQLTQLGEIARGAIDYIEGLYGVDVDTYVIMPDHIHMIIVLCGERSTARVAPTLGRVIGAYKSYISNEWRKICDADKMRIGDIWQRGYYEHIIRNGEDLYEIRKYVEDNPARKYLREKR
jgi:REP element-mobilizing transposase RayT